MSAWGSILGGVNFMIHAAGWLEGGLTASYEKYILDIEMLHILAEVMQPLAADDPALAFEAIARCSRVATFLAPPTPWSATATRSDAAGLRLAQLRQLDRAMAPSTATERANGIWKTDPRRLRAAATRPRPGRRARRLHRPPHPRRRRATGVVSLLSGAAVYAALAARCRSIAALRKLAIQWATMPESASRASSDSFARSIIGAATIGFSRTS